MQRTNSMNVPGVLLALLLCSLTPAWAAAPGFQAELDPVAFTRANRDNVAGIGNVAGNLDGHTLVIAGNFSGLASPASSAHLRIGLAMGVPGPAIAELEATHEVSGVISGKVTLTDEQVARLHHSAVYVQLESVKAPEGNLWGWLEETH
jgi:CHRD domain